MNTCAYSEVENEKATEVSRKCLLRQLFVCSGVWTMFFVNGLLVGAPTVIVPQMRRAVNGTETLGDEMASWLYSAFGFAALPWVVVLPFIIHSIGRKRSFIVISAIMLATYIIFITSSTPLQILIAEIVFGPAYAAALVIAMYIITEYSNAKYRGLFLTIKAGSIIWGVWCSNAIGTFYHWKYIGVLGLACCVFMFGCVFWKESPHWLALNGRFDECRTSYRWLFGYNQDTERDLENLIASIKTFKSSKWTYKHAYTTAKSKVFYKPLILSSILLAQYNLCGKIVCTVYAIDIIKKITSNERTAYVGMLILDGITVLATYFGCVLANTFKRRSLYLTTTFIAIVFQLIISLYLYLIRLDFITENNYVSILLLMCFTLPISCGPLVLDSSIVAEIISLRYKEVSVTLSSLVFYFSLAISLKIAPFLFQYLGVHGTFATFAVTNGACSTLLYFHLPETKDKSLQEIEDYFKERKGGDEMFKFNDVNIYN